MLINSLEETHKKHKTKLHNYFIKNISVTIYVQSLHEMYLFVYFWFSYFGPTGVKEENKLCQVGFYFETKHSLCCHL